MRFPLASFTLSHALVSSVGAIEATIYRIKAPPVYEPTATLSFSIEKPGTTLYSAIGPGISGILPWEVKEIADEVIAHLPGTVITFNQPATRTYTMTQGTGIYIADIPPVEGPVITPPAGQPTTLYEYGFHRYCSVNLSARYGYCRESVVKPAVATQKEPPAEVIVTTRTYTGTLIPETTIFTSLPS